MKETNCICNKHSLNLDKPSKLLFFALYSISENNHISKAKGAYIRSRRKWKVRDRKARVTLFWHTFVGGRRQERNAIKTNLLIDNQKRSDQALISKKCKMFTFYCVIIFNHP